MRVFRIATGVVLLASALPASAGVLTVTNTNDSGAGSLRQAILDANLAPDFSTINFNIPGAGVHSIAPASELPTITQPAIVDGYSQPGASANTQLIGNDAVLLIEITGTNGAFAGLTVAAANTIIQGLVINLFGVNVDLSSAGDGTIVAGNFIGLLPDGSDSASIFQDYGIVTGSFDQARRRSSPGGGGGPPRITIGGTAAQDRNVISGHADGNISVENDLGVAILGNYIGTNAAGTAAVTEQDDGIRMSNASEITVGGTFFGEGNVISGNDGAFHVSLGPATGIVIIGNRIGVDAAGTAPITNGGNFNFFNASSGIRIGGTNPGEGNTIAYGTANGVTLSTAATDIDVRGNSIHDNALLGIGYNATGFPTPNDAGESDGIQNYPIIRSVEHNGPSGIGVTRVQGKFHSTPSSTFNLDFSTNPPCARFPREFLEGQTYFDSEPITTDGAGNAVFDFNLADTDDGVRIAATATPTTGTRNTSEFSQRILFAIAPRSGPPAGGTAVTGSGTDLAGPATVTVGGAPATGVSVPTSTSLTATMPSRPPGTVHDVVVTTPDGTTGTLVNGWVSDFLDVPPAQQFYAFVTNLVSNGVTAGIGGGNYGVDQPTLRQQMAVFLLKAKFGLCYAPPPCAPGFFGDVACPSTFAAWIQALANEGITGGCGGGNYCPTSPVRRDQMAVFLLKAKYGSTHVPPACIPPGVFLDVLCPGTFTDWIEQLAAEQITGGCGGGNYCPLNPNTRGQMAVFITKTFNLQ